jgi:hypothetical protein
MLDPGYGESQRVLLDLPGKVLALRPRELL